VGAASSRDHFIARLEAAPTCLFIRLDSPDKRIKKLTQTEMLPYLLTQRQKDGCTLRGF
jgi:hypothetical protein